MVWLDCSWFAFRWFRFRKLVSLKKYFGKTWSDRLLLMAKRLNQLTNGSLNGRKVQMLALKY